MKILRWIFGFPLATFIVLSISYSVIRVSDQLAINEIYDICPVIHIMLRIIGTMLCFSAWVIVTSCFVPSLKKIGALFPMIATGLFLLYSLYYHFIVKGASKIPPISVLYDYLAAAGGLQLGYFVSRTIFFNKGWDNKTIENEELDIAQVFEEQTSAERPARKSLSDDGVFKTN